MKLDYNQLSEGHSKTIIFHGSHVLVPCSYFFQQFPQIFLSRKQPKIAELCIGSISADLSCSVFPPPREEVGSRGGARAHIPEIEPNLSTA